MEEGFEPLPIDNMGGLVTLLDGADVPFGCSPDCRDVQFFTGNVRTRPGQQTVQTLTPSTTVNYLRTYINAELDAQLLMFDSGGSLWGETGETTKTLISPNYTPDQILQSVTAFGREWIAASDGIRGIDHPSVYDGTNLYLIGNQPPAVGAFAGADGAAGSVIAGIRQAVCYFETTAGALSKPSAPITWTGTGAKKINFTGIPVWVDLGIGEAPVIARRIAITAAGGATFFYISAFRLGDNVTTTLTVDFAETQLLAGEDISKQFQNTVPSPGTPFQGQIGVGSYARRLCWWGGDPPGAEAFHASLVHWSDPDDPEFYNGLLGIMQVSEDDGQGIRAGFELNNRWFFAKEHSLYSVQDDGINPPSKWEVSQESATIGTISIHGIGHGEDWKVILARAGLYYYRGGEPLKISQEIQPTWNAINWKAAHLSWVRVDVERKQLYVGVPVCLATKPNVILMCDYTEGILNDPIDSGGRGRKWSPWIVGASACDIAQRSLKNIRIVLGLDDGTARVREIRNSKTEDDTVAINGYYRTAYIGKPELGRTEFGFVSMNARGSGFLSLATFKQGANSVSWNPMPLSSPAMNDLEKMIDVQSERVSFRVGTNAVGAWFSLVKFCAWLKTHPWARHRGGVNA